MSQAGPGVSLTIDDLLLRPWHDGDAETLCSACQDPEIARWVSIPQPYTMADAQASIAESRALWEEGSASFAIVDAGTDELLGAISRFGPDGHQATIGCWVAREARGRGVGTRAIRAVSDWTLARTSIVRLETFIMVGNEVSERMVLRAGFQREGVLRSWDTLRGVPVDCVAYSRLRDDETS